MRTFIQSGKDINKTEAVEVYKRNNSICPTLEELIAIGNGKSTAYFWFLFTLIRILSGDKEDKMKYKRAIDLLGECFGLKSISINRLSLFFLVFQTFRSETLIVLTSYVYFNFCFVEYHKK